MKNPKLISKPFAQNGQKNVIPEKYETSMESNQATWDQGFGQITMLPVSAGGLPPKGQDFNGILNQMCETIVHISKGGVFKFSADYATAINGYPKGAILQSEDEKKYYQSLIDNNKVNFNTASQDQIQASWKLVMTDDLLDQLSKKLESSAVVQSTGISTTSVMSQKASTDVFQPKGNYQPAGNYALLSEQASFLGSVYAQGEIGAYKGTNRVHLQAEDNGCSLAINNGNGYRSVQILAKNGTMAFVGDSYTKQESDNKYQQKGDYALLSEQASFLGSVYAQGEIGAYKGTNRVHLQAKNNKASLAVTKDGTEYFIIDFQNTSGIVALLSDVDRSSLVPHPIPWSQPIPPTGYLACNGQTFNKSTFPKLAQAYPSGQLPDLRGEFIRGLDSGRGVDNGRSVLSAQLGNSLLSAMWRGSVTGQQDWENKTSYNVEIGTDKSGYYTIGQQIEGQNGNETRPRNIAFLYIVRAA